MGTCSRNKLLGKFYSFYWYDSPCMPCSKISTTVSDNKKSQLNVFFHILAWSKSCLLFLISNSLCSLILISETSWLTCWIPYRDYTAFLLYCLLDYTAQTFGAFRAMWLVSSEVIYGRFIMDRPILYPTIIRAQIVE